MIVEVNEDHTHHISHILSLSPSLESAFAGESTGQSSMKLYLLNHSCVREVSIVIDH